MDLHSLKQLKSEQGEKLEAIRSIVEKENRQMTDDEKNTLAEVKRTVADLDAKIDLVNNTMELERNVMEVKPEVDKVMGNLEAVRSLVDNGQGKDLVERNSAIGQGIKTMGVLVSRAYTDGTDGAAISPDKVGAGINYLEGKPALWDEINATKYVNLAGGTQRLPFMDIFAGAQKAEGDAFADETVAPSSIELTPRRFGTTITVSREGLSTFNPSTWDGIMANAMKVIDRQITGEIFVQAATTTNNTSATAHSKGNYDELEGSVPVDGVYFMSRAQFYKAKGVKLDDGSGLFLAKRVSQDKGETYEGTPLYHSSLFASPADVLVYGVPNNIAVGFWGNDAYEIIVDPYSAKKSGELEITISKIADVQVVNKDVAFAKSGVIV